jgi:hypothetical protein
MGNIDEANTDHAEAAKLATCAQVEYWNEASESVSISNGYKSLSIGSFSVDFGNNGGGSSNSNSLASRSRFYLQDQGLLYRGVRTNANTLNTLDSDLHN